MAARIIRTATIPASAYGFPLFPAQNGKRFATYFVIFSHPMSLVYGRLVKNGAAQNPAIAPPNPSINDTSRICPNPMALVNQS